MIPACSSAQLRIWEPDDTAAGIARILGCSTFTAALMQMRGVGMDVDRTGNGWLEPDLRTWVERADIGCDSRKAADIWSAIDASSNVIVYGDYDADGICSTTLMMELALLKGARVRYYIPNRCKQGYGFHPGVVRSIVKSERKCDLLIVVDCGTQNIEAVRAARAAGIPVVIFDHHLARGELAASDALINPHVEGNEFGQHLCATGVVWCWAWKNEIAPRDFLERKLDLAALATVADCVPMFSPLNRAIVREGIRKIRETPRRGLLSLMHAMELDLQSLDSDSLAMRIIPCLNAAGRLELADLAMDIFFPGQDLDQHVQKLVDLNKKRRDMSAKIFNDVSLGKGGNDVYRHVFFGEDWPAGVLSSVASLVCSTRDAPVVLSAPAHSSLIRGTLRVPDGVDAEAILSALTEDLVNWGGHRMAAGFSVKKEKWDEVREKLEDALARTEVSTEQEDVLRWAPPDLDVGLWRDAERIGPFGVGNPHPKLFCPHAGEINYERFGKKGDGHVRIYVDGSPLFAFKGENILESECPPIAWIYRPRVSYWRSAEKLQLVLEKFVLPDAQGRF